MPSKQDLVAWSVDLLQRTSGQHLLFAELLDHCRVEAATRAGHSVVIDLGELKRALSEGPFHPLQDNDSNVWLQNEGKPASPIKFIRVVPTEHVMWEWLAHEHKYKGKLAALSEPLGLGASMPPTSLNVHHILMTVNDKTDTSKPELAGVPGTIEHFAQRNWWEVDFAHDELAKVLTQLEDGLDPGGPAGERLSRWIHHLGQHGAKSKKDAAGHALLLEKLANGVDLGWLILTKESSNRIQARDGRHRIFAVLDHASRTGQKKKLRALLGR